MNTSDLPSSDFHAHIQVIPHSIFRFFSPLAFINERGLDRLLVQGKISGLRHSLLFRREGRRHWIFRLSLFTRRASERPRPQTRLHTSLLAQATLVHDAWTLAHKRTRSTVYFLPCLKCNQHRTAPRTTHAHERLEGNHIPTYLLHGPLGLLSRRRTNAIFRSPPSLSTSTHVHLRHAPTTSLTSSLRR